MDPLLEVVGCGLDACSMACNFVSLFLFSHITTPSASGPKRKQIYSMRRDFLNTAAANTRARILSGEKVVGNRVRKAAELSSDCSASVDEREYSCASLGLSRDGAGGVRSGMNLGAIARGGLGRLREYDERGEVVNAWNRLQDIDR